MLLDIDLILSEGGSEKGLRFLAVWAPGLGEDDNLVVSNGIVDGLLGRHGCSWRGSYEMREKSPNGPVIYTLEHSVC